MLLVKYVLNLIPRPELQELVVRCYRNMITQRLQLKAVWMVHQFHLKFCVWLHNMQVSRAVRLLVILPKHYMHTIWAAESDLRQLKLASFKLNHAFLLLCALQPTMPHVHHV